MDREKNMEWEIGATVAISADLTNMGKMDGRITKVEPFFDQSMITARFIGESAVTAFPHTEVTGLSAFFRIKED